MSLSKENLLKQFDEYISNEFYCVVDYELSSVPAINKESSIKSMKERIEQLKKLRAQLAEV